MEQIHVLDQAHQVALVFATETEDMIPMMAASGPSGNVSQYATYLRFLDFTHLNVSNPTYFFLVWLEVFSEWKCG